MHALSDDNDDFDAYGGNAHPMTHHAPGTHGHMHPSIAQHQSMVSHGANMYASNHGGGAYASADTSEYGHMGGSGGGGGNLLPPRSRPARGRGRPRKKVDLEDEDNDLNIEADDDEYVYPSTKQSVPLDMDATHAYGHNHHSHLHHPQHGAQGMSMHVPGSDREHPLPRRRGRPKTIPYSSYHDTPSSDYSVPGSVNQQQLHQGAAAGDGMYYDPSTMEYSTGTDHTHTHHTHHPHHQGHLQDIKVVPTGAVLTPMSNGWNEMLQISTPVTYNTNTPGTVPGITTAADIDREPPPQTLTITIPDRSSTRTALPTLSPHVASAPVLKRRPRSSTYPPPSLTESMVIAAAVGSATTPRDDTVTPATTHGPLQALGRSLGLTSCDPDLLKEPLPLPLSRKDTKASGAGGSGSTKDDPMLEVVQHLLSLESNELERGKGGTGNVGRHRPQNIIFRIESPDASPMVFQDSPQPDSGSLTSMARVEQDRMARHADNGNGNRGGNNNNNNNNNGMKQDPFSLQSPVAGFHGSLPGASPGVTPVTTTTTTAPGNNTLPSQGTTQTTVTTTTTSSAPTTTTVTIVPPAAANPTTTTTTAPTASETKPENPAPGTNTTAPQQGVHPVPTESTSAPATGLTGAAAATQLKPLSSHSSFFKGEHTSTGFAFQNFANTPGAAPDSVVGSTEQTGFAHAHAMPLSYPPTARGDGDGEGNGAGSPYGAFPSQAIGTGAPEQLQLRVPTGIDTSATHAADYTPVPFPKTPAAPDTVHSDTGKGVTDGDNTSTGTTTAVAVAVTVNDVPSTNTNTAVSTAPVTASAKEDYAAALAMREAAKDTKNDTATTTASDVLTAATAAGTAQTPQLQKETMPPLSTISIPLQVPTLDTPAPAPDNMPWDSPVFSPGPYGLQPPGPSPKSQDNTTVPGAAGVNAGGVHGVKSVVGAHLGGNDSISKQVSTIHLAASPEIASITKKNTGTTTSATTATTATVTTSALGVTTSLPGTTKMDAVAPRPMMHANPYTVEESV